ncbi:MAG: hypothetical protein ACJ71K_18155 [Nitrososphaeraceae archaeon]
MAHLKKEMDTLILPDDKTRYLAGDEIIADTKYSDTDHINIEAPVSIVWRDLMQLGCDRAGWYSIDRLDNAGIQSSDHLINEWGDRKVGDRLSATPKKDSFLKFIKLSMRSSLL